MNSLSQLQTTKHKNLIVGVLSLQGCVKPHKFHIEALGAHFKEIKSSEDLEDIQGLILPGGESTTMLKLISLFNMEISLKKTFEQIPVWGVCAGSILMATDVQSPTQHSFGLLDMTIERNAYGSQIHSFNTIIEKSPVSFIRAPKIKNISKDIVVRATLNNEPVWVIKNFYMATTFHPELSNHNPSLMHREFLELIEKSKKNSYN